MRVIRLKNVQAVSDVWRGQTIGAGEYYTIVDDRDRGYFAADQKTNQDIWSDPAKLVIANSEQDFTDPGEGESWLKGDGPIDAMTEIKNSHTLQPLGMLKQTSLANDFNSTETLSNMSGLDVDCTGTPEVNDFLVQDDCTKMGKILAVNGTTVTLDRPGLENGTSLLIKPNTINYVIPTDQTYYYLWGFIFSSLNHTGDDFVTIEIVDTYGVLGYGAGFVIKVYDELWVAHLNDLHRLFTPDGAPGELPGSFTIRMNYYNTQTTGTTVHVWLDWIMTTKE